MRELFPVRFLLLLWPLCWLVFPGDANAAEGGRKSVQISFLPPPLESATYSLGIYEAKSGKLIRRLHEATAEDAFTTGLNGLITRWDGKDDAGKPVPAGRYSARGYAVGGLKVEGEEILGNDWSADNENLRIKSVLAIALVPEDEGLAIAAITPDLHLQTARYAGEEKDDLLWQKTDARSERNAGGNPPTVQLGVTAKSLVLGPPPIELAYRLSDGAETTATPAEANAIVDGRSSAGKDGTVWKIEEGVLGQYSAQGERLRSLAPKDGEPLPVAVSASKTSDRFYLLEERKGWQRVRGLSWKEAAKEGDKAVSTWATFFERSIHANPVPGADDASTTPVTLTLVENPLSPGKTEHLKLAAVLDKKGSYLATMDGLRLRQISQRSDLSAARLLKAPNAARLTFYQGDGAAWDKFSIDGANEIMSFDAGEIEMTAEGEKPAETKNAEPPDL